ncbi:unnamed protein product, partial [Rotaria sp. Silwood1]
MEVPEQTAEIDDHKLNLSDLFQRYNTDPKTGLTDAKVKELLIRDGPNILSQTEPISKRMKFSKHLFGEWKSSQSMPSMTKMVSQQILVIRNGEKNQINIEDLVVGNIIEVKSGDRIPADIRIIESSDFHVDTSPLTEGMQPQIRSTELTHENPLETKNLAFHSTIAAKGTAKGLVIRAGDFTVAGRLIKLNSNQSTGGTSSTKEISHSIYSITLIGNVSEFRRTNRKVCEIPFNAINKYQLSIHKIHTNNENEEHSQPYLLVMKGPPERILDRCSKIYIDGTDVEMSDYWRSQFNNAYLELGNLGDRVLGFCDLHLSCSEYPYGYSFNVNECNFPINNLRFLGLVATTNPPRVAVSDTIINCRSAGIKVVMVTEDYPFFAKPIARATNIILEGSEIIEDISIYSNISPELVNSSDAKARVTRGYDLAGKSPEELDALIRDYTEIVFVRVDPRQKAMILEGEYDTINKEILRSILYLACQRQSAIVTMIGSNIGDSPALRQADVGIAMGMTSSVVREQVADIIFMDDNFASLLT